MPVPLICFLAAGFGAFYLLFKATVPEEGSPALPEPVEGVMTAPGYTIAGEEEITPEKGVSEDDYPKPSSDPYDPAQNPFREVVEDLPPGFRGSFDDYPEEARMDEDDEETDEDEILEEEEEEEAR